MFKSASDHDLLFGLLAMQNGLINQVQLVAAFQEWTLNRSRPLAEHLVSRGALDSEQRALIDAVVSLHLKIHSSDAERSLASIPVDRSTRETLASLIDPEGDATVGHARSRPGSTQEGDINLITSYSLGSTTSDGQRFRILRPHARGGLGAVFVAMDTELHREVALKKILDRHADDPTSRARFLLEAEVTGGLEHPGIVPVYGLGTYEGGRPYYAMRFIRGDSLKEAIDRFHADETLKHDPARHSLDLRKLLRRFLDVCNTIDYAHSRGVLHRDIKPANIVLGKHGETLVVDWGLAKARGRDEASASDERPLVPSSASGSSETLPGSTLGTPGYMSPEQACGDLDHLGPPSDVYSLGATLYCLLTGKPPFEGNAIEVIPAVQRGAFQPPRALVPSIDRALEAVCLKAMALNPWDRYSTPKGLGDEVERWMADEAVAAYCESWTRTLTRWLTRHRTGVTAIGAAMLVALIGLGAILRVQARSNGLLTSKNAELRVALGREAEASKEAQANFDMALKAVEDYLTSVSENTLLKQQDSVDLRSLRQELLTTALKYYKTFVNQRNNDPKLRQQLANAYFRVGEITQEIDSRTEAIEAFRSAQTIWEELAEADPENSEFPGRLADCELAIGKQQEAIGDLHGAMASYNKARTILEPHAAGHLELAPYQARLADCYSETGIIQGRLQSGDGGLDSLVKARAIQQSLIARYPEDIRYRQRMAEIINVLGFVYSNRLEYVDAIHCFETVREICQFLLEKVTSGPKPVKLLNLLALSHYNIATVHMGNREYDLALESLKRSLEYRSELVAAHPSVTKFRENLGETYEVMADLQHKAHQDDKAFSSLQTSIDILEKLVQSQPDQARHRGALGRSYNALGYFQDELRHNVQAIPAFERAVQEHERAIAQSPDENEYKLWCSVALDNLAEQYVDLGQVDLGLPYYRREIQIRRQLFTDHPEKRAYLLDLAEGLSTLGNIQRHAGDSSAARASFSDARSLLECGAAARPGDDVLSVRLGAALTREAGALADLREPEQARRLLDRAVRTLSIASASATQEAQRREWQSAALWELGRVLRVQNKTAEAEWVAAQRVALWQDRHPGELATLALKQTSEAALIGYGKTPVPLSGLTVRKLDLDQAAANLKLAIDRGYHNISELRSHPESSILLSREDLKLPIMDMSFPDWPFGDR